METSSGEWTGAILFAKTNLEARKWAANEYNDGELGGMQVTRAPWADEYGSSGKIPVKEMIYHGWHFECYWSGRTIQETLYYGEDSFYNHETKEWEEDQSFIGKEPVGFQYGPVFACQEYSDLWHESKRLEKEFHEEQLKLYRAMVFKRLPDAVLINSEERYGQREYISSMPIEDRGFNTIGKRYVTDVNIPIEFPGMKHWASLEHRQLDYRYHGPTKPRFICASGDLEVFQAWVDEQKEKYKL